MSQVHGQMYSHVHQATEEGINLCIECVVGISQLLLWIPDDVHGVVKHHEDFVKCDELAAAEMVKECMKSQWSDRVKFEG